MPIHGMWMPRLPILCITIRTGSATAADSSGKFQSGDGHRRRGRCLHPKGLAWAVTAGGVVHVIGNPPSIALKGIVEQVANGSHVFLVTNSPADHNPSFVGTVKWLTGLEYALRMAPGGRVCIRTAISVAEALSPKTSTSRYAASYSTTTTACDLLLSDARCCHRHAEFAPHPL
eukprot:TRINITY_DN69318_c0_g1_i1.p1 TRINITY_DN69318_c0_g1~~TRINITY_DN69318_c0_g1_i1.p1  ORF type:complete len:174 (+),score=9.58 TRINITY_DN69318_c0_g1_i1:220-741(+)